MAAGCCGTKKNKLNGSAQGNFEQKKRQSLSKSGDGRSDEKEAKKCKTRKWNSDQQTSCYNNGISNMPILNGTVRNGVNPIACPKMCFFCFDVLYSHLHSVEPPSSPDFTNDPFPLFVTWVVGREKRLRGCMGTFSHIQLHAGLREYAATSAFKDSRFQPITKEEMSRLSVSVSILRHFEDGRDYKDWAIGVHGIRIEFVNERGARRTATYLPEVAPEQGWDHDQTIDSLVRKGGFKGVVTPEMKSAIKLTRYQSEKISITYQEYFNYWRNQRC